VERRLQSPLMQQAATRILDLQNRTIDPQLQARVRILFKDWPEVLNELSNGQSETVQTTRIQAKEAMQSPRCIPESFTHFLMSLSMYSTTQSKPHTKVSAWFIRSTKATLGLWRLSLRSCSSGRIQTTQNRQTYPASHMLSSPSISQTHRHQMINGM